MLLKVFKALFTEFCYCDTQIKIVMLIKMGIIMLHKNTRKLINHLKQAQNQFQIYQICKKVKIVSL